MLLDYEKKKKKKGLLDLFSKSLCLWTESVVVYVGVREVICNGEPNGLIQNGNLAGVP